MKYRKLTRIRIVLIWTPEKKTKHFHNKLNGKISFNISECIKRGIIICFQKKLLW